MFSSKIEIMNRRPMAVSTLNTVKYAINFNSFETLRIRMKVITKKVETRKPLTITKEAYNLGFEALPVFSFDALI